MARKRAKSERQKAIEKADAYCSKYVRLSNADANGICQCYTCAKRGHWKKMTCGHKESRWWITVRYDLDNVRPQCWGCNSKLYGNGRPVEFEIHLIDEIWEERVNAVHQKVLKEARDPVNETLSTPRILEIADEFKELLKPYKHFLSN